MGGGAIDSKWWYGVAGPAILELVGFGVIGAAGELFGRSTDPGDPGFLVGIAGVLLAGIGLFLIPLFAYSAYRDATAVRDSAAEWDPDPRFWGIVGLVVPLAGLAGGVTLVSFVAVPYLYKRFKTPVVAVVPEDGWDETDGSPGPQTTGRSGPNGRDGRSGSDPPRRAGGDREVVYEENTDRQRGSPSRNDRADGQRTGSYAGAPQSNDPPGSRPQSTESGRPTQQSGSASAGPGVQRSGSADTQRPAHQPRSAEGAAPAQRAPPRENPTSASQPRSASGATPAQQPQGRQPDRAQQSPAEQHGRAPEADPIGESSNWWYGVAGVVLVGGIAVLGMIAFLGGAASGMLGQGGAVGRGLGVLGFFGVGGVFVLFLSTPVFTVSMLADVRRLRSVRAGWQPNRLVWGGVALAHLVTFVRPVYSVATLSAGLVYLVLRHTRVGRP